MCTSADEQCYFLCLGVHGLLHLTRLMLKGGRAGEGLWVSVSPWYFYWPQQMASFSLCIVVAILLWLSGLTIVASSCTRQRPFAPPEMSLLSNHNALNLALLSNLLLESSIIIWLSQKLFRIYEPNWRYNQAKGAWVVWKCHITIYNTRISNK